MELNLAPGVLPDGKPRHRPEELQPLILTKDYFKEKVTVTGSLVRPASPSPAEEEEEEEEEKKDKPKPAASPLFITPGIVLRFILVAILLVFVSTVCTHMIYRGMSCKEAVYMTFLSTRQPQQQQQPQRSFYPLWVKHHDTTSVPLSLSELYAKPLISSLEASFRAHMGHADAQYACLCMHHLIFPASTIGQARVCGVYNRRAPAAEMYLLVNPSIIGASNTTDSYNEASVSCPIQKTSPTRRHRQIVLEWTDPETRDVMFSRFSGMAAVCMQLAIDEMNGNKHC